MAARLGAASTVRDVADATLQAASEFLDAVTASLWLLTDDASAIELRYEHNADPAAVAMFARVPLSATDLPGPFVIESRVPCFVASRSERDELWPTLKGTPTRSEALVVLPLEVNDLPLGVVSFGFPVAREFDNEDRVAFLAIADQCAIALDRARLYQAERDRAEGQTLLAALSGVNPRMDWVAIARHAVDVCVGDIADTCAVYVREGHLVRRVAFASASNPELAAQLVDHFPTPINSNALHAVAIRTGTATRVPGMVGSQVGTLSTAPGYLDALRDARIGGGWVFPLFDRGVAFGAMMFLAREGDALSDDAVELARSAAERTSNLIVSASAFAEQRAALSALHEIVLPRDVEDIAGVEIVARYVPLAVAGTIGGDWWDALPLPDGDVGLAIGDVAGHGISSAAVMGHVRNALRIELVTGKSPASALENVSEFLHWTHPLAHCTAIAATLSPTTGAMEWASAGHPPPVHVSPNGDVRFLDTPPAAPLGVVSRNINGYARHGHDLEPGATLLLYTDGLVEGRGRDIDAGMAALGALASDIRPDQSLEDAADRILAGLVDRPDDDICLVAVRRKPDAS